MIVTMTMWIPNLAQSTGVSKYEAIADAIAADIANGKLQPGQRLPTQRGLAAELKVTIGTVGRAYALAEQKGLVQLEVGRGSFVRRDDVETDFHAGRRTIDLGLNLPPTLESSKRLAKTIAQMSHHKSISELFNAMPVELLKRHRETAARWLSQRIECHEKNVLFCSGTQNALITLLGMMTQSGDTVLVESTTFPGIMAAAKFLDLNLEALPMDKKGLIPSELDNKLRSGIGQVLYTVPTNHNPTSITMPQSRRNAIAKIMKRHQVPVIEDDVYGLLVDDAPPPLAALLPERGFLVSSLSKSIAVGLRLALIRYPVEYGSLLVEGLRATSFFPPPMAVEIACKWIDDGTAAFFVQQRKSTSSRRQKIAREILGESAILGDPAGNHVWLELPDGWTAPALQRAARENGVIVYPGSSFCNSTQAPNAIRISLGAARNDHELKIGLSVIARLLDRESIQPTASY